MTGLPTLRVRESIHIQKIRELSNIVEELRPLSIIMRNSTIELHEEHIESINNDIEILKKIQTILKEQLLLRKVQQKITGIRRERNRRERINNITVNVEPPPYNEIFEHHHNE